MCNRIAWDRASRYVRSLGSRAQPGDKYLPILSAAAETCATRTEDRAVAKSWERFSARLLCKKLIVHRPLLCDRTLDDSFLCSPSGYQVPSLLLAQALMRSRSSGHRCRSHALPVLLVRDFENDLQLYRHAKR